VLLKRLEWKIHDKQNHNASNAQQKIEEEQHQEAVPFSRTINERRRWRMRGEIKEKLCCEAHYNISKNRA